MVEWCNGYDYCNKVIGMNLKEHLRKCAPPSNKAPSRLPTLHPASPSPKSLNTRGDPLPPIAQQRRSKLLDLEERQSEVIENLLLAKQEAMERSRSHRNHTEAAPRRNLSINFEENRMKPIDIYYQRLENIRMAERLLTVKPSPGLQRQSLKKFYLQQRNYRSQISKKQALRKASSSKPKMVRQWLF